MCLVFGRALIDVCACFFVAVPSVTSLSPPNGPCAGGTLITVLGETFGTTSINFNGRIVPANTSVPANVLAFNLPAGTGAGWIVISNGPYASNNFTAGFTYDAPQVTGFAPPTLTTSGLVVGADGRLGSQLFLTVQGRNFGRTSDPAITVTVDGVSCPVVAANRTDQSVVCASPSGAGVARAVVVALGSAQTTASISYADPTVTSLSGCTVNGISVINCLPAGGQTLFM